MTRPAIALRHFVNTLPLVAAGIAASFLAISSAQADILAMPGKPVTVLLSDKTPARGQTQAQVLESFGEPAARSGPVGQPPISSWKYPGFEVYFERQHVIHTVVTRPSGKSAEATEK